MILFRFLYLPQITTLKRCLFALLYFLIFCGVVFTAVSNMHFKGNNLKYSRNENDNNNFAQKTSVLDNELYFTISLETRSSFKK